jgi:DNA-binding Lrp family transcriptional regulator
MGAIKSL